MVCRYVFSIHRLTLAGDKNVAQSAYLFHRLLMVRKRKQDDDEGEVTRCICGNEDLHLSAAAKRSGADPGLFIQCDKCHVWQHGYCVGFSSASEVPEVYYCEKCKPELHIIVVRPNGRTSRYIPYERKQRRMRRSSSASDSEPESGNEKERRPSAEERRRRTLNSREDVILQRVLEQSAQEALEAERVRGSVKSEPGENAESDDNEDEPEPHVSQEEEEEAPAEAEADGDAEDEDPEEDAEPKEEETGAKSREGSAEEPKEAASPEPLRKKRKPEPKRPGKRRGPQPKKAAAATPVQMSKKCKPRIPPPRSTLADMRKRIQAIIEFSGRTQIEMLKEAEARDAFVNDQQSRGAHSTAAAMEALCTQHKTNIQSLEALTRKLLQWQELYG